MGNVNIFGTFSNLADLKKSSGTCLPTLGSHEEENFLGYQQKKTLGYARCQTDFWRLTKPQGQTSNMEDSSFRKTKAGRH